MKLFSSRDAVLVKGVQVLLVLLCGLLVQVAEVLHGGHAALGGLLSHIQLLHEFQRTGTLERELIWTAVMTLSSTQGVRSEVNDESSPSSTKGWKMFRSYQVNSTCLIPKF